MPLNGLSAEHYQRLKVGNLESSKRDHFRPDPVPFDRPLTQRNYIVHHSLVQEGPAPLWTAYYSYHTAQVNSMPINPYHSNTNLAPGISLRDTTIVVPAGSEFLIYSTTIHWNLSSLALRDCEIYCGNATAWLYGSFSYDFENNLFVYPSFDVENSGQLAVHNNLFIGDVSS